MLALFLLLQSLPSDAPAVVPGHGAPTVSIPRLEATITIDGVLDEPAWSQAVRLTGFSQYQPVDGRPAEEQTDVLVWYSPEALHLGIIAKDHDASSIRATVADRDNLDRDDSVTIYLDTFNDRRRAFFFTVNPLGVQQDGVQSEGQFTAGTLFGGTIDKSPDYRFDSKGLITQEGYVVEVRIPFKSLRYPGNGRQRWGINFKRKVQRTGYEDTWTDVRRAGASFLAQAGAIEGMHDLKRGVVSEIQPFITVAANGLRDAADGQFRREHPDVNPGANFHLGFTNMSIDATVKPDFSQVESDAGLVTVNERFALFFPEKRPFFLEGIELFATPNQLVYTRQIVQPKVGGKFTGKLGDFAVAYLSALDDTAEGDVAFNIARVRRDFGKNSIAGVTYTDRTGAGDFNRVLSGDVRVVFAKLYYVQGQLGQSWTRDDGQEHASKIWEGQFDRTGRAWGFNYRLTGIGDSFAAQAGFVPRNNIVEGHAFNRLSVYGKRGALMENLTFFFGPSRIWEYRNFGSRPAIEGNDHVHAMVQMRGGWNLTGSLRRTFVRFDPKAFSNYAVDRGRGIVTPYRPPERLDGNWGTMVSVATPTYKTFNGRLELQRNEIPIFPEASEGRETRVVLGLSLRPTESIRVDASNTVSFITRHRNATEFARTAIPRLKIEYQPRRSLLFRMIGEYRSQRQSALEDARTGERLLVDGTISRSENFNGLRLDWLFSYEPTPGTVFFCGYGASLETAAMFNFTDLRRTDDGFFVKLAYLFRF